MSGFKPRECRECGGRFEPRQSSALFCSSDCREAFNRRRRDRGAELYDVLMAAAYDEGHGDLKAIAQNMVQAYRASDFAKRGGRRSWQSWDYASLRIPVGYSVAGDKR